MDLKNVNGHLFVIYVIFALFTHIFDIWFKQYLLWKLHTQMNYTKNAYIEDRQNSPVF